MTARPFRFYHSLPLLLALLLSLGLASAQDAPTPIPMATVENGAAVQLSSGSPVTPEPPPSAAPQLPTPVILPALPSSYRLDGLRFEHQGWNNCGPATITNALSYFGYSDNQNRAAAWLKPNGEDKNVSPSQMAEYVNTQVPELPVSALVRVGGTLELLKRLIVNNFPVIIEKGYDPEPQRLGWMGHYLLMVGYDDAQQSFTTYDSYIGQNTPYSYEYIETYWKHFNYLYLVLYTPNREAELLALLGRDADVWQNQYDALQRAVAQANSNQQDAFAWFNIGSSMVALGQYENAVEAFNQARAIGLPWRLAWYRFDHLEAYYKAGLHDVVLAIAQANLNDGGGQYVEETYYYGGLARLGKGEIDRAISNFDEAIRFNPHFLPARQAREAALAQRGG